MLKKVNALLKAKRGSINYQFYNEFDFGGNFYAYIKWIKHEFYVKSLHTMKSNNYVVIKLFLEVTFLRKNN